MTFLENEGCDVFLSLLETNLYADGYFDTLIAQGNILLGTRLVAPSMGIHVWGTVTDTDALQLLITFPLPIADLTTSSFAGKILLETSANPRTLPETNTSTSE